MKYEIKVLKIIIKNSFFKLCLPFVLLLFIYFLIVFQNVETNFFEKSDIINLLFINNFKNSNFLVVLLVIYQICLSIYLAYSFYFYDYNASCEFVFLRLSKNNYLFLKIIIFLIFMVFSRIVFYYLIYILYNKYISFSLSLFFRNIFDYLLLSFLSIITSDFIYKKNRL